MKLNTLSLMITEELITYPTAQLAKQAGFDLLVHTCYNSNGRLMETSDLLNIYCEGGLDFDEFFMNYNNKPELEKYQKSELYSVSTQSLLQRWIREVHNIDTEARLIRYTGDEKASYYQAYLQGCTINMKRYATHELALEQALQEALTIIINRKDAHLS